MKVISIPGMPSDRMVIVPPCGEPVTIINVGTDALAAAIQEGREL